MKKNNNNKTRKNYKKYITPNKFNKTYTIKNKVKAKVTNISKKILSKNIINKEGKKCIDLLITNFEDNFSKTHQKLTSVGEDLWSKIFLKKIDETIKYPSNKITPQNDFYTWVNHKWLKQQEKIIEDVKTYYFKFDSFRILQDKVYVELLDLVNKYIQDNKTKTKNLSNFLKSFSKTFSFCPISYSKTIVNEIDNIILNEDLYTLLVYINKNELISSHSPIMWNTMADPDNSKIFISTIDTPILTLPNYDTYFEYDWDTEETKKEKKMYLDKFTQYINDIFVLFLGENYGIEPKSIIECEKDIIIAANCDKYSKMRNIKEEYMPYKVTKEQSNKLGFDWERFSNLMGYSKTPEVYVTSSIDYIECIMNKLKNEWRYQKWRFYWLYIYFDSIVRFSKHNVLYFDFHRKFLLGSKARIPSDKFAVFGLSIGYNKLLTELYIKNNPKDKIIEYVKRLAEDLKLVFIRKIKNIKWLQPETKKNALLKLEHLKFIYGSPEIVIDDPIIQYNDDNSWDNLLRLSKWRIQMKINLVGHHCVNLTNVDWDNSELIGSQAYIVNAFYTPNKNDIFIPQAYLQKPFIDLKERGIEYNLAFIGFTLCHEMSHSVDKDGSKYDYKGNMVNWWTPKDYKTFEKINQNIIKQYEVFAARDGLKIDASITAGEDLADSSGFAIISEYLRDFQENNYDSMIIRILSFKALFIYYAIQSRQTIYPEAIKANIENNPHPLEKYRTNCVLARSDIFQKIYNIKKGDGMYWPHIKIW